MQKRKWKKQVLRGERFRVQLTKPKIQRFAPENNQPHGRETYYMREYRKRKGIWVWVPYTRFCSCKGCNAYLEAIKEPLPSVILPWLPNVVLPATNGRLDRVDALTENDGKASNFRPKKLPEHVHRRRMLAQSIGKWK
jgi:hypothetical protein